VIVTAFTGDQPDAWLPLLVRARTPYLPVLVGLNLAVARVVSFLMVFQVVVPGLRTWTSNVVLPLPVAADQRSVHPAEGEPEALTGTRTVPRMDGWMVQV
jgi:hypothetical protein